MGSTLPIVFQQSPKLDAMRKALGLKSLRAGRWILRQAASDMKGPTHGPSLTPREAAASRYNDKKHRNHSSFLSHPYTRY